VVGGSIAAMVVSTASQISKGEIERIWLIFYPWSLIAAVAVPDRRIPWWLGAQVAVAVILQMGLLSKW
jgi:methylthioxylose transferase